ncbi:undecaprenyl-diphosphatase [Roseimicrobium gellanilyticum]|uniref:Undecaprenyl-diphosphatase n=1 Tax=Roseimicrobium gellanilyticum TaxID=748857 RepID=A0A366HQR3_9BACT|nr:phosphatase PAP2 family protein [Roseimicrobium gellanilyticum]RBP45995.1 undecaprenyl-diphosphatase [Roseimicrobium gellanilyticum]
MKKVTLFQQVRDYLAKQGLLEMGMLLAVLGLVGSIWAFSEVADEVMDAETDHFDAVILRAFRVPGDLNTGIGPKWMPTVVGDLTALGGAAVLTLIVLIVLAFLLLRRKWGSAVLVLCASLGGALISTTLKGLFQRARPSVVPHLTEVTSMSFPSGHSMLSAVIYLTLGALLARTTKDRKVKAFFLFTALFITVMVGTTRVYLGVHFPTDVLAGWCAGTTWALLCVIIARWLQKKRVVEPPGESATPADG